MKVVLATDARGAGGVGRHIRDLAEGLIRRGVRVRLAGPAGSRLTEVADRLGVRFRAFEQGADRADVWHLHLADTFDRRSLRVLAGARLNSRRVVVTEHLPRTNASDPDLTADRRRRGAYLAKTVFKRLQLGLAHSVITVSTGSRRFLIDRYGLAGSRIVTIHNGVPLDGPPRPLDASAKTVLAVGSLIRQKGHDVLIHAAAATGNDWTVVVAGAGPHHDDLTDLAHRVAPGRVRLSGWVDDVPALMARASVVCLPSRWESFAYVPLEAMAMGVPVVASRVDGIDEVVTDGTSGLLVEPDDPRALAAAIDRLIDDTRFAGAVRDSARRAVAGFGVDTMVDKTLAHYHRLGAGARR